MRTQKPIHSAVFPIALTNANDGQGHAFYRTDEARKKIVETLGMLGHERLKPISHGCVRVVITRILGKRQRLWDPDSVGRGNAKQLIDSLVELNWFHDDSAKYIRPVDYRQDETQRENGPAVLIEVFECT